jgi:hypothetical protein
MVAYYGIYAHHRDSVIIVSYVIGLFAFIAMTLALKDLGAISVPIGTCAAYLLVWAIMSLALRRMRRPVRVDNRPWS